MQAVVTGMTHLHVMDEEGKEVASSSAMHDKMEIGGPVGNGPSQQIDTHVYLKLPPGAFSNSSNVGNAATEVSCTKKHNF